jgi:hypothetical protein
MRPSTSVDCGAAGRKLALRKWMQFSATRRLLCQQHVIAKWQLLHWPPIIVLLLIAAPCVASALCQHPRYEEHVSCATLVSHPTVQPARSPKPPHLVKHAKKIVAHRRMDRLPLRAVVLDEVVLSAN